MCHDWHCSLQLLFFRPMALINRGLFLLLEKKQWLWDDDWKWLFLSTQKVELWYLGPLQITNARVDLDFPAATGLFAYLSQTSPPPSPQIHNIHVSSAAQQVLRLLGEVWPCGSTWKKSTMTSESNLKNQPWLCQSLKCCCFHIIERYELQHHIFVFRFLTDLRKLMFNALFSLFVTLPPQAHYVGTTIGHNIC